MKTTLKAIQEGNDPKTFKFETVCPYPFDRAITMTPFPKNFEIPKFDNFRGKGDPVTHIKEFYMHYQEVAYSDTFLLRLFPKILARPALEWFYRIPYGTIQSFAELSEAFVAQYAHLVETELSVIDLVHTKQKGGESLAEYLQRWKTLTIRISCNLPERHLVKIFIDNAHPSLAHHMTMNCLQTYKDIKEKGMILEQGLIKDGVVKIYKEANQNQTHSNDKSRYWKKNKHVATDGVTDTRHVNIVGPSQN